jgi:pimeloyl-ACP methyl ester carboxylesterase
MVSKPIDRFINVGIRLHIREWYPEIEYASQNQFLLLHGLSSNAHTWNQVASKLAGNGHHVIALDQRGHGLSQKPDEGYDFDQITKDINKLLDILHWEKPILIGQSWGGNVLLEYGARHPGKARCYIFVDGGFLNLKARGTWEEVAKDLHPPDLTGIPRQILERKIRTGNPNWSKDAIEATLHNFKTLRDGSIRPFLTHNNHMLILQAMYHQDVRGLYPLITEPVLICIAKNGSDRMKSKRIQLEQALQGIKDAKAVWFPNTAHDIHVDRPNELANAILKFIANSEG